MKFKLIASFSLAILSISSVSKAQQTPPQLRRPQYQIIITMMLSRLYFTPKMARNTVLQMASRVQNTGKTVPIINWQPG
jgi:hypothetical protein